MARATFAAILISCLSAAGAPVAAETLRGALGSAYAANPQIKAERARLRGTDEELARAKSGYRPTLTGTGVVSRVHTGTKPASVTDGSVSTKTYSLNLVQPIYRGGRTAATVSEAEANIRAGRESLRTIEQTVMLQAVTAFMDVIRDQAIVRLRQNNVRVLTRELRATQDRFAVGEVTKTDVAQARARRAGAVSALDLAKANLRSSRAVFARVVGHPPGRLVPAGPAIRKMPKTLTAAIAAALSEHPSVVRAVFLEQASRHTIARIRGELLPTFQLEADYQKNFDPSRIVSESERAALTGRLTIPLYQAGDVLARIRQAKQNQLALVSDIETARLQVRSDVIAAWSQYIATRARLASDQVQVRANQTALAGVREEEKVGQRTLLDVLDAQQELLDAQVALATTRRDLVVASYTLLQAMGRLSAGDLGLGVDHYDPDENLSLTKNRWWGTTIHHEEIAPAVVPAPAGWAAVVTKPSALKAPEDR